MAVRHTENGMTASAGTDSVLVRGVTKTFATKTGDVSALEAIDLTIAEGEFVALIGPSGCGKSTLLRLIADLDTPTAGTIEVFGKPATRARRDQDYGIAFQQAGLLPWRTVAANIALPLELHGVGRASARRGSPNSPSSSGSPTSPTGIPISSPAECSSASRSRGRWPSGRGCFSWTSRSAPSTR